MKRKFIQFVIILLVIATNVYSQLAIPEVEAVYGGRINAITGYAKTADTSRIFISTESANSIFYADVDHSSSTPVYSTFTVMPGLNASAGFGESIQRIAAHPQSGKVFFIHQDGLLSSHPNNSIVDTVFAGPIFEFMLVDSGLVFLNNSDLRFGMLDSNGNFAEDSNSPLATGFSGGLPSLIYNPVDSILYGFESGASVGIYKTSDKFFELDGSSTSWTDISPSSLSSSVQWTAFGISPSGRLFLGGTDGFNKHFAYSDDESSWTTYSEMNGVSGRNFAFSGDSTSYKVYFAKGYNHSNGIGGSWEQFGNPGGLETHPNDGSVFVDPVNNDVVYMTTDQGIGSSYDSGMTIFEIDEGVEAVQVNDISMTDSKNTAWLASKSGIRRVRNYRSSSPSWTNAIFPNGDGSPYYSAEMNHSDSTIAYVGNVRVYKTSDDGSSWQQIFSPENAPYNFSQIGTKCLAIEEAYFDENIIFAGYEISEADKGGLFFSTDAGATWDQILLEAASFGQDVDVTDIVFNIEGTDTVAYVSAIYDLSAPQGRSVYRVVKSSLSWTASQDMNSSGTSTGSVIVVTLWDVEVNETRDTIYAVGTDAGINHPTIYYKPVNSTNLWTPITTSNLPNGTNVEASAFTEGNDTLYIAVNHEVYYLRKGTSSSWQLGFSYPVGTRINFLYFDDLLVGTSLGLFAHFDSRSSVTGTKSKSDNIKPDQFTLYQNYPNPFNPTTLISFNLSLPSKVVLKVYDTLGREVAELINGYRTNGIYNINFDANELPTGVYIYTLKAGNKFQTRKMVLIK
ncbi:MAG: T9SS type A sorting domain-containing protein [Melioribacteraceae bacterium]|nr:T9SS type A sorting domain-containing protein [Melioribacteraceae bacterium]MCF8264741.1 T9SS type A sorting domain-containing protein [Melioribacteraceae bacterium]MCF8432618.1 T9SS type A sorting domain-containing protein [Melioribacteraceae bacterium]